MSFFVAKLEKPKCGWTEWCQWSSCDGDCNDGETRARTRMCDCETPECDQSVKDEQCPGPDLEEEPCNKVLLSLKFFNSDHLLLGYTM